MQGQDPQHFYLGQDLVIPGQGLGNAQAEQRSCFFSLGSVLRWEGLCVVHTVLP